ncbi:MAG: hypothetical protein ACP5LD_15305 [Desulfomonilaceae bacterium]
MHIHFFSSKFIVGLLRAARIGASAGSLSLRRAERDDPILAAGDHAEKRRSRSRFLPRFSRLPRICRLACVVVSAAVLSSCGVISNLDSMRASMDQMAYYTGLMATNMPVMAHSTSRIADTAVRMDKKTDEIFQSLEKRATAIDRNIVGTAQDTLAQNKQLIKELTGIKGELAKITVSLQQPKGRGDAAAPDAQKMTEMQQKLRDLEKQIEELGAKVKKLDKTP